MTNGPLISASQVVNAMRSTLQTNYQAVRTALGMTSLPDIKTWNIIANERAFTTANLPGIAIVVNGTSKTPERTGPGVLTFEYDVFVYVFDHGASFEDVATKIMDWCALIRATVLAYPSLGGLSSSTHVLSETYDEIPSANSARSLGGGGVQFAVTVEDAVDTAAIRNLVLPGVPVGSTNLTITSQE